VTLRDATLGDADLLLAWRNDPETISFSRSARPVSPTEHSAWFSGRLNSSRTRIWIGEVDREAVGQVRVDYSGRGWEIDIAVAPEHRGMGFARELLRCLQAEAPLLIPQGMLRAEVMIDNVRSLRAFGSVGFKEVEREGSWVLLTWTW
jgi:RimJ/RimL family protein N-acetyltransferase